MFTALTLVTALAASSGLLVDDSGITANARDASIEDALRAGARHPTKAKKALELVFAAGERATPVQTWRALKQAAKFDPAVQAKLDAMVPALPFTAANGAQAKALNGSFERALLDSGALPITADPARRKGELNVTWTMRMVDDATKQATADRAWSIDATASLTGKNGGKAVTVKTKTLVKGATADKAAVTGMGDAADDLVKALLVELARDAIGAPVVTKLKASPRSIEKVAALRERAEADGDRKSRAVLDAFPARVNVDVAGRGDMRVWTRSIEGALVGVSQGALPLVTENADHTMRVTIVVEEMGGNVLAAGSLRRYTLKAKAQFVFDEGSSEKVLAELSKITMAMGSTPEEAAQAGAEKTARALYDAMIDEVSALRHRRIAAR